MERPIQSITGGDLRKMRREERAIVNQLVAEEEEKIRKEREGHRRGRRLTKDEKRLRGIIKSRAQCYRRKLARAPKKSQLNEEEQETREKETRKKEARELQRLEEEAKFRKRMKEQYEQLATIMDQEREQHIRAKNLTKEERVLRSRTRAWISTDKKRMERAAKDPKYRQYLEKKKETGRERLPHGHWSSNLTPEERRIRKKVKIQVDTQNHYGYNSELFKNLRQQQRFARVAAEKQKKEKQIKAEAEEGATSQAQPPPEISMIKKRRRRLVRPNYHSPPPDESDQNDDSDEPPTPPSPVLHPEGDGPAAGSSAAASSEKRISRALMNLGFVPDEDE